MTADTDKGIDLIWGAEAVAKEIGRSRRQTFHLLTTGVLPAKQLGGRWVIERSKLYAFCLGDAA